MSAFKLFDKDVAKEPRALATARKYEREPERKRKAHVPTRAIKLVHIRCHQISPLCYAMIWWKKSAVTPQSFPILLHCYAPWEWKKLPIPRNFSYHFRSCYSRITGNPCFLWITVLLGIETLAASRWWWWA